MFNSKASYKRASAYCSSKVGGPSGNQKGWLVSIHGDSTNKIVQNLLKPDQRAFIGLSKIDGRLVWADKTRPDSGYRRWNKSHQRNPLISNYGVAVAKDGWETVRNDRRLDFVCEMSAAVAAPTMTCPPCEEGKPLLPVECTVHSLSSYGPLKQIAINGMKSPSVLCRLGRCIEYENNTKAMLSKKNNQWKTTVNVDRQASRRDDGVKWSCSAEFQRTLSFPLRDDCTRHTFVTPKIVDCKQSFSAVDGVLVECTVHGVFPKAASNWFHYNDNNNVSKLLPQANHVSYLAQDGVLMYNTTFTSKVHALGRHKIETAFYPNILFFNDAARLNASAMRVANFSISAPEDPPVFSTENGLDIKQETLTTTEGQTVVLVCEVNGGKPQVNQTFIDCQGIGVRNSSGTMSWKSEGPRIKIEFIVTRNMDPSICICKAQHVSNQYNKTAFCILRVLSLASKKARNENDNGLNITLLVGMIICVLFGITMTVILIIFVVKYKKQARLDLPRTSYQVRSDAATVGPQERVQQSLYDSLCLESSEFAYEEVKRSTESVTNENDAVYIEPSA